MISYLTELQDSYNNIIEQELEKLQKDLHIKLITAKENVHQLTTAIVKIL
jgi:hypothetical protein